MKSISAIKYLDSIEWMDNHLAGDSLQRYSFNEDGSINLRDAVLDISEKIDSLPDHIQFKKFERVWFTASHCGLKTMRGFPEEFWDGMFDCSYNNFDDLKYAPKIIHGGRCSFANCGLKSFKGSCESIKCSHIYFNNNELTKFDNDKLFFSNDYLDENDGYKRLIYNQVAKEWVEDNYKKVANEFTINFSENKITSLNGFKINAKGLLESQSLNNVFFFDKNRESSLWNQKYIKTKILRQLEKNNKGIKDRPEKIRVLFVDENYVYA